MKQWTIEVVKYDGLQVVRRLRYNCGKTAETAERGLLRQINVADYFTRIAPPTATQAPSAAKNEGQP